MTTIDRTTVADTLADAAGLIAVNGHYIDHDFWPRAFRQAWRPGLPLDVIAAVYVARGVTTYRGIMAACITPGGVRHPDVHPAIDALLLHLGLGGRVDDAFGEFWLWEDRQPVERLVAVMRECAAGLRAEAAA